MNSQYFLHPLSNIIDYYSNVYGNHIVVGSFNLEPSQMYLETFMETHTYFNLEKKMPVSKAFFSLQIKNIVFKVLPRLKQD